MAAISDISVPVGPQGSLLVAAFARNISKSSNSGSAIIHGHAGRQGGSGKRNTAIARLVRSHNVESKPHVPFRTFTCTEEYPLVTFLTLRTTLDMVPDVDATSGESERGKTAGHTGETDQTGRAIVTVRALTAHSLSRCSEITAQGCCSQTNSRVEPALLSRFLQEDGSVGPATNERCAKDWGC